MNRFFTLLLAASCITAVGQVPDYVPTDGLVGWWPMDGNGSDVSGNDLHLLENEVTSVADRLNQQGKALQFNGESSYLLRSTSLDLLEDSDTFSIQFWAKAGPTSRVEPQCIFYEGFPGEFHFANADPGTDFTSFHWAAKADGNVWYGPGHEIDTDWFHVVGVQNAGLLTLYLDGQIIGSDFSASCCVNAPNDQMVIGARRVTSSIEHPFDGIIDDFGIWKRALTEEEVLALYISEQPVSGCTNPAACNYEPTATEDDGSCLDSISILNVGDTVVITEPLILESSGTQCSWSTGAETCSIIVTESGWYSVSQLVSTSEGLRIDPGQQVSLGGEDDFNFGTGDFSIAIWFRSLDSITDYSSQLDPNGQFEILGKRPTSFTNNNNFYYDIQAGISQHTSYGTTYQAGPGTKFHWNSEPHPGSFNAYTEQVVCDGSWHHLTAVKEGTTLKMAIDGSFVHSAQDRTPSSGQIADNNGQLFLGVPDSVYAPMSYFIGQVQIFNAALTETDLESVMAEAIDSSVTSLLGAWEFRGEDASHLDLSGGGNHAELFGASLVFSEVACFSSDSVYIEFIPPGCTNPEACNYDDLAVMNDGSCLYLPSMTLPDSVATCEDVVTLEAPAGYDSYSWSTSETTPSVQITESGTYVVEGHVFGPWGWVTGEEVSVTFWNTLQETPNEGCAEMYSSDGFHIADCSEAKLFVLEFDSMEELGGGEDLSIDGFIYVNPEDMLECNSGLDVGLSSVYFLSTEALSFGEAQSICEGLGGHLVSINSEEENNFVANIDGCYLGCGNACPGFWIGMEREVCSSTSSIEVTFSMKGCTDPEACNYNPEASCDNGTCASCEALATACGAGTVWDPISLSCIVANPADTNLDGCVQLNDLLDVLSAYGDCGVEEAPWECGDPLEYQGYDYATVQIGEQCWFAENLRAENYRNGESIPSSVSNSVWQVTDEGSVSVFGESMDCEEWAPFIDACDPSISLGTYGRLYNWYAVNDDRGLCASGWHVPSDAEWISLELGLGMLPEESILTDDYRGMDQGIQMKLYDGWDASETAGTNSSNFSGLPGGYRSVSGLFWDAGRNGYFWSATIQGTDQAYFRNLTYDRAGVYRAATNVEYGFSVRCIKDTE